MIEIYTDGSVKKRNPKDSRGAGMYSYVKFVDGVLKDRRVFHDNDAAVNEMEMKAIRVAIESVRGSSDQEVVIYTDSNNAVNWINGEYKCNAPNIRVLLEEIVAAQGAFFRVNTSIDVVKIDREHNKAHVE